MLQGRERHVLISTLSTEAAITLPHTCTHSALPPRTLPHPRPSPIPHLVVWVAGPLVLFSERESESRCLPLPSHVGGGAIGGGHCHMHTYTHHPRTYAPHNAKKRAGLCTCTHQTHFTHRATPNTYANTDTQGNMQVPPRHTHCPTYLGRGPGGVAWADWLATVLLPGHTGEVRTEGASLPGRRERGKEREGWRKNTHR